MVPWLNQIITQLGKSPQSLWNLSLVSFKVLIGDQHYQEWPDRVVYSIPWRILWAHDRYFPIKNYKSSCSKRSNNQWIFTGLKKSSKRKETLYKKFLQNPTQQNEQDYKRYRNKLNHLIRIAKKSYYSERFSQARNNTKSTWNTINYLLGRKKSCSPLPRTF